MGAIPRPLLFLHRLVRGRAARIVAIPPRDFRPLHAYAHSRSLEPEFPTANDVSVLLEARQLAPSVMETAYRAGAALMAKGRRDEAVKVLTPLMNNPHGEYTAAQARKLLDEGGIGVANIEPGEDKGEPPGPPAT